MTAHARCIAPENTLVEAAGLMRELDVGVLPVCDHDRLAGMVTDRDIVVRGVADGRDAYTSAVRDVMSPGVVYVLADQEVEEAARIMEEKQIRRLPVLNREKRLVGILSLGDVAVRSHPAFSGQALKEVSESPEEHMRGGRRPGVMREQLATARARFQETPGGARRTPAGARKSTRRDTRGTRTVGARKQTRTSGSRTSAPRGGGTAGQNRAARAAGKSARGRGKAKRAAAGGARGGRVKKTAARTAR